MTGTPGHTVKGHEEDERTKEQRLTEMGLYDPLVYLNEEPEKFEVPWDIPGWVYVVAALDLVKIGVTNEPKRRLGSLRSQNAAEITTLFMRPFGKYNTATKVERSLHAMFAKQRRRGEWFALSEDEIAALRAALEAYVDPKP